MKKLLTDAEIEEVSGAIAVPLPDSPDYKAWQADLAISKNPNGFGAIFDEWKILREVKKLGNYGIIRCPNCGSWKIAWHAGGGMSMWLCDACGLQGYFTDTRLDAIRKYGAKGVSIYWRG